MMSGSSYNSRLISVKWQDFDIHKKDVIHFSLDPVNDQQIRVTMPVKSSSSPDPPTSGENSNTLELIAKEVPKEEQLVRLHIFTPPFCTNFPHLTVDLSILAKQGVTTEQIRKLTKYIDLCMLGAGNMQKQFRVWMDTFDDLLLDFVHSNQRLIGKFAMTKDALRAIQRRMFRPRVSQKTGRQYEDSCIVKCKSFGFRGKPSVSTAIENMVPCFDKDNQRIDPTTIEFHHVVSASLRYDGCYANSALGFGNMWTLLALKDYGDDVLTCPVMVNDINSTALVTMEDGDLHNPIYLFPEIEDTHDYPRQFS
jgi:hypothetical protein